MFVQESYMKAFTLTSTKTTFRRTRQVNYEGYGGEGRGQLIRRLRLIPIKTAHQVQKATLRRLEGCSTPHMTIALVDV